MSDGTAIVTGAAGQDGYFLASRLLEEGMAVHATVRDPTQARLTQALAEGGRLTVHVLDAGDAEGHRRLIAATQPVELYNLAGASSVAASFDDPRASWETNAESVLSLLEAVRMHSPHTHIYQASSTDMYGLSGDEIVVSESTRPEPASPYAAAKVAAHQLCHAYRAAFGLRIACGILGNHESHRRPARFLTRKIVDYVAHLRTSQGSINEPLRLGNLTARRDWGFAPEYVDGMVLICRQIAVRGARTGRQGSDDGRHYRDYVLGTGVLTSVRELADRAFELGGFPLDWEASSADPSRWAARLASTGETVIVVDPSLARPVDPPAIRVDATLANDELGWIPSAGVDRFLLDMLEHTTVR